MGLVYFYSVHILILLLYIYLLTYNRFTLHYNTFSYYLNTVKYVVICADEIKLFLVVGSIFISFFHKYDSRE